MFVKPAEGLQVRDPRTGVRVPDNGRHVPDHDLEWVRLLQFGDIVLADPPAEPAQE